MKMLRTLFLSALLLALLGGCGGQGAEAPAEPSDQPLPEPKGQEDAQPSGEPGQAVIDGGETAEEKIEIRDSADEQPLLTVSLTRPDVTGLVGGAAKKAIDRYYDARYREDKGWWTGGLADFALENKKAAADYGGTFLPFSVTENNEIVYDGPAFLSILRDVETYTGGAHGAHLVYCENFRKSDGSLVVLPDLFRTPDYKAVLLGRIAGDISVSGSEEFYSNWEDLLSDGFDEGSFYLGPEALTIVYQEYDIAPYSAGTQAFPVSYADISNELSEPFLRDIYGGK